jgi:hypothetical protein
VTVLATPAVAFANFVLAIHILGVVIGFGATFAYPLIFAAARRADPSVMPWLWSLLQRIDRYLINPGLGVVVLAGIYLASSEHHWGSFFVSWGIGGAIVIGAAVGSFTIPRYGRLAELAERDLAAVPAGGATPERGIREARQAGLDRRSDPRSARRDHRLRDGHARRRLSRCGIVVAD